MIDLPENCALPKGYRWGAYWSTSDNDGHWILRELDDAGIRARSRPDLTDGTEEDACAEATLGGSSVMTAEDVLEVIREAFADLDSLPY